MEKHDLNQENHHGNINSYASRDSSSFASHAKAMTSKANTKQHHVTKSCSLFLDNDGNEDDEGSTENFLEQLTSLKIQTDHGARAVRSKQSALAQHPDLFAVSHELHQAARQRNDSSQSTREQIQLQRLLGDYMLSDKGDRIMLQLEEILSDDEDATELISAIENVARSAEAFQERPSSPSLSEILHSMDDFERYIAEN